jgi:hypothetical protein
MPGSTAGAGGLTQPSTLSGVGKMKSSYSSIQYVNAVNDCVVTGLKSFQLEGSMPGTAGNTM